MAHLKLKQGESSNVINLKVSIGGEMVTDLAGYACEYRIKNSDGTTAQSDLSISASSGAFPLRLTPAQTQALDEGQYSICAEITNATQEFNRESLIPLQITPQSLV